MSPTPQILLFGDSIYLTAIGKALSDTLHQHIAQVNARTIDRVSDDLSNTLILTMSDELQIALTKLGRRPHRGFVVVDTADHSLLLLSGTRLSANSLDELIAALQTAQGDTDRGTSQWTNKPS